MTTDAQVHLWEPDRPDRPWPPGTEVSGQHGIRPNGFGASEMLAAMDAAGVDRAVIVPPSWAGENNATPLEAAAAYPRRFAVMGRFDPSAPNARLRLEGWLDQPHMLGIRLTFNQPRFVSWLDDGSLDWFWSAMERLSIPLMIHLPGMLPKLGPIAERHPSLRLIIDHLGAQTRPDGVAVLGGIDALLSLARYPNVTPRPRRCRRSPSSPIPTGTSTASCAAFTTASAHDGCCGAPTSRGSVGATVNAWTSSRRRWIS